MVHSLCSDLRALEYSGRVSTRVHESAAYASGESAAPRALLRLSRAEATAKVFSSPALVRRLCVSRVLEGAQGCVNSCSWSAGGDLLVASGDDTHAQLWHGPRFQERARVATGHVRNVFCVKFVPESAGRTLATAAMDGSVHVLDVEQASHRVLFADPDEFAMKLAFLPNCPSVMLSSHGGGLVNMMDVRSDRGATVLLRLQMQALGLAFDPLFPTHFAVGAEDHLVRVFDLRSLGGSASGPSEPVRTFSTEDLLNRFGYSSRRRGRITASDVTFNDKGELLVNYSNHDPVLFDCHSPLKKTDSQYGANMCTNVLQTYSGRANADTFLKEANFMLCDRFVVTGGDSGCVYAWDKLSGKLHLATPADNTILNGVSPHPYLPLLATCGIDSNVKIFDVEMEADEVDWDEEVQERERVDKVFSRVYSRTGNRFLDRMLASMYEADSGPGIITHQECRKLFASLTEKKEMGNTLFKAQQYRQASAMYKEVMDGLAVHATSQRLYASMERLYVSCLLNSAACCAKLGQWEESANLGMQVLQGDRNNAKALYRIAESHLRRGDRPAAEKFVEIVVELVPNDPSVRRLQEELDSLPPHSHADAPEDDGHEHP